MSVLVIQANSLIRDLEQDSQGLLFIFRIKLVVMDYFESNFIPNMRKLDRVAQQVYQNLLSANFVYEHTKIGEVVLKLDFDLLGFGRQTENVNNWRNNIVNQSVAGSVKNELVVGQESLIQVGLHLVEQEASSVENYPKLVSLIGLLNLSQKLTDHLNHAAEWSQHLMVAARAKELHHLVLRLQFLIFVERGDILKCEDQLTPVLKNE